MSTPAPDNRANPNLPDQARRPDDPSEGQRKDTGRNDRSQRVRLRDIKGDVWRDGQQIRPVDPDQPDIDPIGAPDVLTPLNAAEIDKFRQNMMDEVVKAREFEKEYNHILHLGDEFVRAGSDYEKKLITTLTNKSQDIWDFFNEDERLFNKRNVVGPPT